MTNYLWVSNFSGCGGSTIGAIKAGFTPLWANDFDKDIAEIYRLNIKSPILTKDIKEITFPYLDSVPHRRERDQDGSILVFQSSPPCQDYSRANTKKDNESDRARILLDTVWMYKKLLPEYIVIENVPSYRNSQTYLEFQRQILDMGYDVNSAVLDAANYGVPQNRKRFFAVFNRTGYQRIDLYKLRKRCEIGWYAALKDLLDDLEETTLTESQSKQLEILPSTIPYLIERVGYYNGKPKIRSYIEPCWTLRSHLADDGKGGTRSNLINIWLPDWGLKRGKKLDTRCIARLQSFDYSFKWSESFATNVKAIGNSVAPKMMEAICNEIKFCVIKY
jgi:DNA (cytosine-5)-methyltransferase 1